MDESTRRRRILQALAAAGMGAGGLSGWMSRALAMGDVPGGAGVARLQGSATVNGRPAQVGTPVKLGDRIATAADSQAVVVLSQDAFLLRAQTIIEVKGRDNTLTDMLVASGRVLSVFAKKKVAIKAANATIGIRGTGGYLEIEPAAGSGAAVGRSRVYFCLCYGTADIEGPNMTMKTVETTHHESPLYLSEDGGIMRAEPGPFQNHSDAELVMLEALVGREPPFMKDGQSPAKRY